MQKAINPYLQNYVTLTEFLGHALGPDYEVALHDLTSNDRSIIAIANNHVSGREVGAPMTNVGLSILRDKSYETANYRLHYVGEGVNGKTLRSNTMFIKQGGKLIGMLCINFDDSRYQELSSKILELCHPDGFVARSVHSYSGEETTASAGQTEKFPNTPNAVVADALSRELERMGVAVERMTLDERLQIISALERDGIFLLKGAVKDVAAGLRCSQASVYRYITQLKSQNEDA